MIQSALPQLMSGFFGLLPCGPSSSLPQDPQSSYRHDLLIIICGTSTVGLSVIANSWDVLQCDFIEL